LAFRRRLCDVGTLRLLKIGSACTFLDVGSSRRVRNVRAGTESFVTSGRIAKPIAIAAVPVLGAALAEWAAFARDANTMLEPSL
jgi:hypothetical protein